MAGRANRSYSPDAPAPVRVSLRGEIDAAAAPGTLARLMEADPCPGGVVTVDLSNVAFIDSVGVAMLQEARTYRDALGGELVLTNPSPAVVRVFTILGLLEYFSVENSVSVASAR